MYPIAMDDKASSPVRASLLPRLGATLWSDRKPVYYACALIGLASGLAALLLKLSVHAVEAAAAWLVATTGLPCLRYAMPTLGIALTLAFTRYVVRDDIGHGVAKVLKARAKHKGIIAPHNMFSSIVGAAITVGAGGSAGLEAPVMYTGSAIGSNLARLFRFDTRTRIILVGCGSAAAVSAIYKAPIAGIVFALEVLMIDSTIGNKLPLIVSSITGALVSMALTGNSVTYSFAVHENFSLASAPYYALLGILCGLSALHLHKSSKAMERLLGKVANPWLRAVAGGAGLGLVALCLPPLLGEGLPTLKALLMGHPLAAIQGCATAPSGNGDAGLLLFLAAVLAVKPIATGLTTGAGGVGGIFAPSLFMGGLAGFLFSRTARLLGVAAISEANFTLVGMAALLSGLMHAPLTGIFLIAEITGGYELFIPLLIASVASFATHRTFSRHSVYAEDLAAENALVTHDKDAAALLELDPYSLVDSGAPRVAADCPLGRIRDMTLERPVYVFAVVDEDGRYLGDLRFDDIRGRLMNGDCEGLAARDFATRDPGTLGPGLMPAAILDALDEARDGELPVVDGQGRFQGFLRKDVVLDRYRRLMIDMTKDYA